MTLPTIPRRSVAQDCCFLSVIVLLSFVFYVGQLGFYSDDWSFLGYLSTAPDQSIGGLFQAIYSPQTAMRPVQVLYLAVLFDRFGFQPLGYHLINAGVLLLGILLFYLSLIELNQGRVTAVAIVAVYALLPHYATDRFWYAAFQANLSMTLYFLSLYADLRVLRSLKFRWEWKLLSLISLLGSALAYEVFLPLFLMNLLVIGWQKRRFDRDGACPMRWATLVGLSMCNVLVLGLAVMFKAQTTTRVGQIDLVWQLIWFTKMIKQALIVSYGDYGLGLLGTTAKLLLRYPNLIILALAVLLSVLVYRYLDHIADRSISEKPKPLLLLAWGLVIFGCGYAIFLNNQNALITPTGIGNRVAIAAAIGVALSWVGGIYWLSGLLPLRWQKRCFCLLITLVCACGLVINNTIATFWIDAYRQQQTILTEIRQQFPTLPSQSTLILDGICPYSGAAIVFESNWDLVGALMMLYGDRSLQADVVTPNLKVEADGISTRIYGSNYRKYPYSKNLFVYHFHQKTAYPLPDLQTARRYFQTLNPDYDNDCPRGEPGLGVELL